MVGVVRRAVLEAAIKRPRAREVALKPPAIGKDKVVFEIFEGATHENARFFEEKNVKHIIEFFDKYLKPKK